MRMLRNGVNEMRQSSIIIHKGGKETRYEIYVEDYVVSFLKGETGTLEMSEFYFYGYAEKEGRRYIIYGAGRERDLPVFNKYSLLEKLGCRLTQAGPVFQVREGEDTYEVKGYDIFYQENGEMQNYLIDRKNADEEKDKGMQPDSLSRSMGQAARRRTTDGRNMKKSVAHGADPKPITHSTISAQLSVILVVLVAIVINSTNSYDKMQQLNQSASEVFFAMENQEAEYVEGTGDARDEIVVERDMPQEDEMQEELLVNKAQSDDGQEDILKLVTLENEGQAEEKESAETEEEGTAGNTEDKDGMAEGAEQGEASEEPDKADIDGETENSENKGSNEPEEKASDEEGEMEKETDGTLHQGEDDGKEEEVEALSRNVARYYRVERGDTLYMISKKVYGDTAHVKKICEMNNISDPDNIRYGQKIILP